MSVIASVSASMSACVSVSAGAFVIFCWLACVLVEGGWIGHKMCSCVFESMRTYAFGQCLSARVRLRIRMFVCMGG